MKNHNHAVWRWARKLLAVCPALLLSMSALAQNAVQSVTGSIQGDPGAGPHRT